MDEARPQFGNRFLIDKSEVFTHNAWDNVEWDEELENNAKKKIKENSEILLSESEIQDMELKASSKWDQFYSVHQNRFFKDRHWLFTEFAELQTTIHSDESGNRNGTQNPDEVFQLQSICQSAGDTDSETHQFPVFNLPPEGDDKLAQRYSTEADEATQVQLLTKRLRIGEVYPGENSSFKILEVGCGVGNTVFPILQSNIDPSLFVYCCDFSREAVTIVKESENYDTDRCFAFKCDLTNDEWDTPYPRSSLDVIICIFVLSALHPGKMKRAVEKLSSYLKPGGILLFRDYGRYDMAQLRFKKGRCLDENFYARGDGTRCYFFTQDEVRTLMTASGLEEVQNLVDRRLQVNRGKQLTMYRVWIQAKYRKPV